MNAPAHHQGVSPDMLSPPPENEYFWWQEAQAGRPQPFQALAPQSGFYRYRPRMADRGSPAAIWYEAGQWIAWVDDKPVSDVAHVWRFCAKFPVTESRYREVCEGGLWPEETAATEGTPTAGHNSATPEEIALDAVRQADEGFRSTLKEWGGKITNEEQDAVAKGYDERISTLRKDAEKTRKAEKDEFLKGGNAIDAKWTPIKTAATAAEGYISEIVTPYRNERKRLADAAAAAERAEREKQKAEQAAAAAAATAKGETAPPAPIFTAPRTSKPATGLRKVETVVIEDAVKLATYLVQLGSPDVMDALRNSAFKLLKANAAAPGARLDVSYKA